MILSDAEIDFKTGIDLSDSEEEAAAPAAQEVTVITPVLQQSDI
jgi:hypothetical protein